MKLVFNSLIIVMLALAVSACTSTSRYSGNTYDGNQVKSGMEVQYGTVTNVRVVNIQAPNSGLGGLGGGAIGAIGAGGVTDSRTESRIIEVVGGIVGSVIGNKVEERINRVKAYEIEVKLDSGTSRVVVQKADQPYAPGQRVRLVGKGSSMQVTPAN